MRGRFPKEIIETAWVNPEELASMSIGLVAFLAKDKQPVGGGPDFAAIHQTVCTSPFVPESVFAINLTIDEYAVTPVSDRGLYLLGHGGDFKETIICDTGAQSRFTLGNFAFFAFFRPKLSLEARGRGLPA